LVIAGLLGVPTSKGELALSFRFKVQRVNHLRDAGLIILDGIIESGKIFVPSKGALAIDPSRRIQITGVGSKCGDLDDPMFSGPPGLYVGRQC
jgi:hypothetical protein